MREPDNHDSPVELIGIDYALLKIIEKTPGVEFGTLVHKLRKNWSKYWVSKRLKLLHQERYIIRTKKRSNLPMRAWPVDHPDIPMEEEVRL